METVHNYAYEEGGQAELISHPHPSSVKKDASAY